MKFYDLTYQKNIRDIGGLVAFGGKTIKYGKIYRGGSLHHVTNDDVEVVKTFHLTDIVDFRSKIEFAHQPDCLLDGVTYHNLTTFEHEMKQEHAQMKDGNLLWFVDKGVSGHGHMIKTYKELVDTEEGQAAYRNLFKILLQDENRVLYFHCSQGKDRVGVGAYLIESALGVSLEDIKYDYLLSNTAMDLKINGLIDSVKDKPFYNDFYRQSLIDLFTAKLEYLQAAIDVIDNKYGGTESFLRNVLEVDIERLRELYLE